jgi:hypothetical protein
MTNRRKRNVNERFWEKVNILSEEECWEWKAYVIPDKGYGTFWYMGENTFSHRMSWFLANGNIPSGLEVLHRCDNPPCVNPRHLFLGTQKDNMQDMIQKGRRFLMIGELHANSVLTANDVIEIRRRRKETGEHYDSIGRDFNLHSNYARDICTYKTWKHLP